MSLAPEREDAKSVLRMRNLSTVGISTLEDWEQDLDGPKTKVVAGDARETGLDDDSVDLIVTSPPYG